VSQEERSVLWEVIVSVILSKKSPIPNGFRDSAISLYISKMVDKKEILPTVSNKVKLSLYRPWRPLGLREVEAPAFSNIRLIDGGKVVSLTRRPLFTPRKLPGTHFC
jgi:hypothetical protein